MRSDKLFLAIALAATAVMTSSATDYTWNGGTSGDWETPSNWTGGDDTSYPLAATDKAIIPVTATTSIYLKPSAATTIAAEINIPKSSTANAEARLIRNTGFDVTFTGKFTGDGIVRLAADTASGAGASSAQSIILDNDQSEFEGTFYFNSTWKDRFQFGTSLQPSQKARYIVAGTQAGNIQYNGTSDAVFSFGSFYTTSISNRTSAIRFNTASATPVLEIGAANGKLGDDRLTVQMGDNNSDSCSYVKIRKVGTGNLVLGDTRHSKGSEINGGTVTLVHKNALLGRTTGDISFGGGTLVYGDSIYEDNDADGNVKGEKVTTDYSAYIKNSTAAIAIDTNDRDVTFATALAASNQGGLVKKGAGKLAVAGYSSYTGKTIVSNGTLSVGFDYNGTKDGINREFEVEDGAKLEVTLRNTSSTRPSSDILTAFPNGTTVNLEATDVNKGYPRWDNLSNLGWNGTVNFANSSAMTTAGGFVASASTFGSSTIGWGVTGAPESLTRVVDFEYNDNANINLGSFNWPSENAGIFVKKSGNWNIGGRNEPSLLNGQLLTYAGVTVTVNYNASSTLTIGSGFGAQLNEGQSGADPKIVLNVSNGSIVNNGDLSGATVKFLVNDITISGSGSWPENMTLPESYKVAAVAPGETPATLNLDVDFSKVTLDNMPTEKMVATLSKDTIYTVFTAKSIRNWTNELIKDDGKGKWKLVQSGNSLILRYTKVGFVMIFR